MPSSPLKQVAVAVRRIRKDANTFLNEFPRYAISKLRRQSYMQYQVARYDEIYSKNLRTFRDKNRTFQLAYCRDHGLTQNMRFLDYGCGPMAAGVSFVQYLEPNGYTGADISSEALGLAKKFLDESQLTSKNPTLIHLPEGNLDALNGNKFDFIWAQSVFTHMAPDDVERVMLKLPEILAQDGQFMATFNLADRVKIEHFKNWNFPKEYFQTIFKKIGMNGEILTDFKHPSAVQRSHRQLAVVAVRN